MYKWYIEIIFKSGYKQKGFLESKYSGSKELSDDILDVGKPYPIGTRIFNNMFLDDDKKVSVTFETNDISVLIISDKPL